MSSISTLTFYSNFLLHHQTPFCEAMVKCLGDGFRFVATIPIPEDRLKMGYHDFTSEKYVINAYANHEEYEKALSLARKSDVVIIGSASEDFAAERLREDKLTFRYSERYFKEGGWRLLDPRVLYYHYLHDWKYQKKNLHMLCASAYTSSDCKLIRTYTNRMYKWGYFPPLTIHNDISLMISEKKQASILWVGRMLKWKHPEVAVELARQLKKDGYQFSLTLIGDGEERRNCQELVEQYDLERNVSIEGFMSPEEVRGEMEKADIFLFSSDQNEGWGAVLNEAMNSACAVVACRQIGSVPFLIEDGFNGFWYQNKRLLDVAGIVEKLLDDNKLKKTVQINAYHTVTNMWNADMAAERLLTLSENLLARKTSPFASGPCSNA